jgi:starch phosphorylase
MSEYSVKHMLEEIEKKLNSYFGCNTEDAGKINLLKACILVMRDILTQKLKTNENGSGKMNLSGASRSAGEFGSSKERHVHYLSLEFLLGRSLEKNAYNLGAAKALYGAIQELGYEPADFFELEPDAALGNGGLGRLAACYLDAMTTMGIPATGYSLLYEYGIFKQKMIDGEQQELPDKWLDIDDVWMISGFDRTQIVRFGGNPEYVWREDGMHVIYTDSSEIRAVPADMLISGYKNNVINRLRLWTAQATTDMDLNLFSQGQYLKSLEQRAMAEVITKVLYPEDNHYEGKSLRLRQQYFFVSATVQDIIQRHMEVFQTLDNFHEKHVLQINDTHPTFVIPELMRILIDDYRYEWDAAWHITKNSVAFTNHTVLSEALECWPQELVKTLVPRVYDIILEIHRRFEQEIIGFYGDDRQKRAALSILWENQVRMANICVAACRKINGVSMLHAEILRTSVFPDAYRMYPAKFTGITNGIDHRRWLAQSNPLLHGLVEELIGDKYLTDASRLEQLGKYQNDAGVLDRLAEIKRKNKITMAGIIKKNCGVTVDPSSMFDVQVKRLHEYKRQLLNVMHILYLYEQIKADPGISLQPRTFIFGAKAAPGYHMAKKIIRLINSIAAHINSDPIVRDRIKIVFLENYRVSLAERLMPASELSEQISLAGKEASGTGNMKFMINGALTVGTMDGANVEIFQQVGKDNIFIFGMSAAEAMELSKNYRPLALYDSNETIHMVVNAIRSGFNDGVSYGDIVQSLLFSDTYLLLADFTSYLEAQDKVSRVYGDKTLWNRMALKNISKAGYFAADRSVGQYASEIWGL